MNRDGTPETEVQNVTGSFAEANLDWQPLPPFPQGAAPVTLTVGPVPRGTGMVTSAPSGTRVPVHLLRGVRPGLERSVRRLTAGGLAFLGWTRCHV